MSYKTLYTMQPYRVGTKKGKSLAMIIPARFARLNHIDTSTIFILKYESSKTGNIFLQRISPIEDMIPADESFEASQQVSSRGQ